MPGQPFWSVARTVKLNVPVTDGVPLSAPLAANDKPVGNAPALSVNEYGAVPPLPVTV